MRELGSIQNVGRGAYVNNATPRKAARDKGGGGGQPGQNAAAVIGESVRKTAAGTLADEPKSTLRKSFVESFSEADSVAERGRETAMFSDSQSASTFGKIDRSFGVEEMTYANMWKVLKTAVREIGEIKEAISGQFFLGVTERLEKANTLMEFDLIADYTEEKENQGNRFSLEMVPPEATDGEAGRIVADPEASLQAQANVVPDMALHLLGGAG